MKITLASILPNNESWVARFKQIPKSSSVSSQKKKKIQNTIALILLKQNE